MGVDFLLSRLKNVRRTGAGRWVARCPAHDDRHPSLSVRLTEDGRILLHCFAACATADVLAAVQMDFRDLFPERSLAHRIKSERRPWHAADVLACIKHETTIVAIAASHVAQGRVLNQADYERLQQAAQRLQSAVELAIG
jgi:hypothetical protein